IRERDVVVAIDGQGGVERDRAGAQTAAVAGGVAELQRSRVNEGAAGVVVAAGVGDDKDARAVLDDAGRAVDAPRTADRVGRGRIVRGNGRWIDGGVERDRGVANGRV